MTAVKSTESDVVLLIYFTIFMYIQIEKSNKISQIYMH